MAALRASATLVHVLPGVAIRLRARRGPDDAVLMDASRPPARVDGTRWMPPCAFRAAVGEAHRHAADGRRFGCLGLPWGIDPAVELGVVGSTVLHPGGIVA